MYTTDKSTESQLSYMEAGIRENVELQKIAYEPAKQDGTGQMILRFYFQNDGGLKYIHTEFPIDAAKLTELAAGWKQDPKQVIEQKFMDLGGRVRHILKSFLPEDKCEVKGTDWESFCKSVITVAGQAYTGEKFRVKLVLNNKDMVSFPNKAIKPFIQNMKEPNVLAINPKWDRTTPMTPDASAASTVDNFTEAPSNAVNTDLF